MADEDLQKTFVEAQMRLQDLSRQLGNCKSQIFQRDREARMADLTIAELQNLLQQDGNVQTYKGVGKMFLKMEAKEISAELTSKSEKYKREVNVLDKTREYLESNIKDQQSAIKEILKRRA